MNAIEALCKDVEQALPGVQISIDRPKKKTGHWWVTLKLEGHEVIVEWRPSKGFGIHCGPGDAPFTGPEEVIEEAEEATLRVIELLRGKRFARAPRSVALRDLREMAELTQEELAERLGVGQAAVSKMERRKDVTLAVLRRWVESLGGNLEVLAKFPDEVVKIGQFDDVDDAA